MKLHTRGFSLVYRVQDEIANVVVIAVGKRDDGDGDVYDAAEDRYQEISMQL